AVASLSLLSSGSVGSVDDVAAALDGPGAQAARSALALAVHHVFLAMTVVVVLGVPAVLVMPRRERSLSETCSEAGPEGASAGGESDGRTRAGH
ncbi:hypothetical protein ACFQ08_17695, partial [Streptosporangium algeriense]